MARRIRWRIASIQRAESGGVGPWGLAIDAAVAVTATAAAVLEQAQHDRYLGLSDAPVRETGRLLGVTPLHPGTATLAAAAMTALPLAFRRCYPVCAWLVIATAIVGVYLFSGSASVPAVTGGTILFAAYSAVTHSRYRNLAIAAVTVMTVAVVQIYYDGTGSVKWFNFAFYSVPPTVAGGLGVRGLRDRLAENRRRADAQARAATEAALAAERSRIAAELHDVVTHNVSVMIVQAGAARKILSSSPADAQDALLAVEATGRDAMTELRNLLGLLSPRADGLYDAVRAPGADHPGSPGSLGSPGHAGNGGGAAAGADPAMFTPQPGLAELGTLVGRVSAAGLQIKVDMRGEPRPLPPAADLAAYRVVQEGLTNVLRHAREAMATVAVDWGEELVITVTDDGRHGPACLPDAVCSGCGSGSRCTTRRSRQGRGRAAAGNCGRSCRSRTGAPRDGFRSRI